jgi:hypothetical protein
MYNSCRQILIHRNRVEIQNEKEQQMDNINLEIV